MSALLHPLTGDPVLVDRVEACKILDVTDATFARLRREGRFENMAWGGHALYRSAELRRYRTQAKRLGGISRESVTNAIYKPKETAALNRTSPARIGAGERNDLGLAKDTRRTCEGCGGDFRPRRADARVCSATCRRRRSRAARRAVA
jgi:hypothetical protein